MHWHRHLNEWGGVVPHMRILLGAVPFGCDNAGDEAILECTVATLRETIPAAAIGVCTAQPLATARALDVAAHDLFGFKNGTHSTQEDACLDRVLANYDAFMWAGATGLSDYPEVGVRLMNRAGARGLKTILWCVGMNDELNPKLYRAWKNPLVRAAAKLGQATRGRVDIVTALETRKAARARASIAACLDAATLRVVRDPESKAELRKCGVMSQIIVGADPALFLAAPPLERDALPTSVGRVLDGPGTKLGVCLSAQGPLEDIGGMAAMLDGLLVSGFVSQILFVPMNPKTDNLLGAEVQRRMQLRDRTAQLEGERSPGEIQSVIGMLGAIVSSRLHALILAANAGVPFVGIARGTKFDSFLAPFGLEPAGTVDACDMEQVDAQIRHAINNRARFEQKNRHVRDELAQRYERGVNALGDALGPAGSVSAGSRLDKGARVVQ